MIDRYGRFNLHELSGRGGFCGRVLPSRFERVRAKELESAQTARFAVAQIGHISQVPNLPVRAERRQGRLGGAAWSTESDSQAAIGQDNKSASEVQTVVEIGLETANWLFARHKLGADLIPPKWRDGVAINYSVGNWHVLASF